MENQNKQNQQGKGQRNEKEILGQSEMCRAYLTSDIV